MAKLAKKEDFILIFGVEGNDNIDKGNIVHLDLTKGEVHVEDVNFQCLI